MASDIFLFTGLVGDAIDAAILLYAAYWALVIRRALMSRIYKAQAIWIGLFGPFMIPYVSSGVLPVGSSNPFIELGIVSYYVTFIVLLFSWIDATIRLARLSDPLLRDTFRWKLLRYFVWSGLALTISLVLAYVVGVYFLGLDIPKQLFFDLQGLVYLPPLIIGGSAVIVAGRRSGDQALRKTLKWFGLFLIGFLAPGSVYFISLFAATILPDLLQALSPFFYLPMAYFLYRSAKSLAPLNRIELASTS